MDRAEEIAQEILSQYKDDNTDTVAAALMTATAMVVATLPKNEKNLEEVMTGLEVFFKKQVPKFFNSRLDIKHKGNWHPHKGRKDN